MIDPILVAAFVLLALIGVALVLVAYDWILHARSMRRWHRRMDDAYWQWYADRRRD